MKKRIAIVNQRYGAEVNGGSEYYTKKLAEHLTPYYNIEVLTTTAKDYDTWANYYPGGQQTVNGVAVRRFAVEKQRNIIEFRIVDKLFRIFPGLWKIFEPLWIKTQGPYCPKLIRYIRANKDEFDVFIFMTYLYYTTVVGLPEVAEKAIFVPTAHDESYIYFHAYRKLFQEAKALVYLTEEEQDFVQALFKNEGIPHRIAGSGVDIPEMVDIDGFRSKYQIDSNYVIYVGRVDTGKNCDELFEFFARFNETRANQITLVVVGKLMMEKPECGAIRILGYIPEADKYSAIAGARALIMPSAHESLSLVVLEAMALGVPVVVNGACEVLEGHCRKSNAGICYNSYAEFALGLDLLFSDIEGYHAMRGLGIRYVKENYNWNETVEKYRQLIEK